LVEATIDQTKNRVPIWTKQYFNNDADKALELLPDIIEADPTSGKYSEWLIKQWRDGTARFPEDIERLSNSLTVFHAKKTRLQEKDINKYTPDSLAIALEQELGLTQKELKAAQRGELMLPPGAKLVLESGPYQFVKVTTVPAATQLASRTEWCVANKPNAAEYLKDGPLYLVYKDGKRDVLIHFENGEFRNVKNKEVPINYKFELVDFLAPVTGISKENSHSLALQYALEVVEGRWPEGEEAIGKDAQSALDYAIMLKETGIMDRWPEGEEVISKVSDIALQYALEVVEGRWPEGEEAIGKDAQSALDYAIMLKENGIMDRWPAGEEAISKNGDTGYQYARNVLEGRWPEGEEAISKHSISAMDYAINVVKGEWPEGEEAISTESYSAFYYAVFINKRFPQGEFAISNVAEFSYVYARDIIKGRFPQGERAIIKDERWAKRYEDFLSSLK
jgi:hypothetical protein